VSYVTFAADSALENAVAVFLQKTRRGIQRTKANTQHNVIDPFSAMFEMAVFGLTLGEWQKSEEFRQSQKSLSNHLGEFHQCIIGALPGWKDLAKGNIVDAVNQEKRIVVEIKNKYNTIKGSDKKEVYNSLDDLVSRKASIYHGYTAYLVEIIPKKPTRYDYPFTPSDHAKGKSKESSEHIRTCDGASFYHLATGVSGALEELYQALPAVLQKVDSSIQLREIELNYTRDLFRSAFGQAPS
jgi:Eco47II restriction endonuclease